MKGVLGPLGVEAKGWGISRNLIGWELKANPKSFRLGVKANNYLKELIYKMLALRWPPGYKRNPHGLGSQQRILGPTSTQIILHLRLARASKELKYWSSWLQDFTALTPSIKLPLVGNSHCLWAQWTSKHLSREVKVARCYLWGDLQEICQMRGYLASVMGNKLGQRSSNTPKWALSLQMCSPNPSIKHGGLKGIYFVSCRNNVTVFQNWNIM